ncbi:MAG: hypothetical protein AMXMBFR13_51370 [Phycisphaerae bacterium]
MLSFLGMPKVGLEPTRPYGHGFLKPDPVDQNERNPSDLQRSDEALTARLSVSEQVAALTAALARLPADAQARILGELAQAVTEASGMPTVEEPPAGR